MCIRRSHTALTDRQRVSMRGRTSAVLRLSVSAVSVVQQRQGVVGVSSLLMQPLTLHTCAPATSLQAYRLVFDCSNRLQRPPDTARCAPEMAL